MISQPISVYINWASYDELSDNVELTEELAMRQLDELLRLRQLGVRLDYYLMDCFWFALNGGYRTWRKPHWPDGPDRFFDTCLKNDVKPALWIGGNSLCALEPIPAWRESVVGYSPTTQFRGSACLFYGGFWPDLLETLEMWYRRGVRLYKFDFMNLDSAPPSLKATMLPSEIRKANEQALLVGLKGLRARCPDLVLIGYNGLEEADTQSGTALPFRKTIGTHWLEAFDAVYCGDPRPADVPTLNFWRSKDIFSDHMVSVYQRNGFPLERIDNAGFMIGTTGTCYNRRTAAWKGMLLLSLARGGWVNTYYGNLDLLDEEKALWFARAQHLFYPIQAQGRISTFGGIPGEEKPYGYLAQDANGALVTVLNPSQQVQRIALPLNGAGRVLFADAGFVPTLEEGCLSLGPEQLALVGFGRYNDADFDLGIQEDVHIATTVRPLAVEFSADGPKAITTTLAMPSAGSLRIILRQYNLKGQPQRTTGGAPPDGIPLDQLIILSAEQEGKAVPVCVEYGKAIWSGLSWAAGSIDATLITPGLPLTVRLESKEPAPVRLQGELYLGS
jgi:hypothetical protein